ncbi:hypothetical protein SAMN05216251_10261 [Actinacidiphila alni]|uniref:Uncharacterized protein n=1 Tax=Actinacidiphila alni TaxID=380248 RepID=A0A1I1YKF5_9ACTN|nr:hypothetical protein [Actinacidiphila alni]SFE19782.1 hypothetical protein SAMN05216251_10261 [Actinacidiphila alni]
MAADQPYAAVRLPEGSWWDWDVLAWNGGEPRLAAGYDLSHHHELELTFASPLYVSCPAAFHDTEFHAPTPEESRRVTELLGERPPVLAAFEADAGGTRPARCLIAAERLDVVAELVPRHWREDAAPGQRFAPWVRRPAR